VKSIALIVLHMSDCRTKVASSKKKENKIEIVELSEHALRASKFRSQIRSGGVCDVQLVAWTNLNET
jgi:hypothetical protein